ncbi:MAG: HAD family hydrolase [Candidatus Aminicenantes bacterium]|jgi:phosphoglycolate phosphatase
MRFQAVIFDLDGTLLDSLGGIAAAMNALLDQMGYPLHPLENYRYFVGAGLRTMVNRALPGEWHRQFPDAQQKESRLDRLEEAYRNIYSEKWPLHSSPYPGIPELLKTLSRLDVNMAVLSNKSEDFTKRMVLALLPGCDFDMVLGARRGVPVKPDPAAALEIAAALNRTPGEMIFLGDSGVDMQTGVNAEMYPLGALWGFRDAEELLANGAKQLIKHPLDLIKIMDF